MVPKVSTVNENFLIYYSEFKDDKGSGDREYCKHECDLYDFIQERVSTTSMNYMTTSYNTF